MQTRSSLKPKPANQRMAAKIYLRAQEQLLDIWEYTERTWGEDQADDYIRRLTQFVDSAASQRHLWRPALDNDLMDIYFIRYRHHYIFFRELAARLLGVISILHESMDL